MTFAELLRAVDAVEGIERIRYTSPHPKDMREDVILAHAECEALCEHIHLPLQSGSSPILKAMRRTYTRERYLDRVALIREHVPDCALTTDIIVGFPGETDEDFERTLEVVDQVAYDGAFTFVFSPRRGTEAATMDGQVPHPVKQERMKRLVDLVQARAKERAQRFVGRTLDVLVEGPSRTDPTRLRGRSRHNKAVNFEGTAQPGDLVEVEIDQGHVADAPRARADPQPRRLSGAMHVVAIFGPTAVGKTGVAIALADLLRERGEDPVAVGCDSIQVYRGLEVLSGAPTADGATSGWNIAWSGLRTSTEEFSAGRFAELAHREIDALLEARAGGRSSSAGRASTCGPLLPSSSCARRCPPRCATRSSGTWPSAAPMRCIDELPGGASLRRPPERPQAHRPPDRADPPGDRARTPRARASGPKSFAGPPPGRDHTRS